MGDSVPHDDEDETGRAGVGAPSRKALAWIVAPVACLLVASWIGDAVGPGLVPDPGAGEDGRPELLLALSPRTRWQVAVVNYVDPVVFYLLAGLRLLAADPPFFLLGYWYGESALRWAERNSPAAGALLRDSERFYGKLAYPLVAIAPNNIFCLLAGASRMRPPVFLALNVTGTAVRLYLIVRFGEAFEDQIESVLGWVGRYRWWLVGLSTLVVVGMAGGQFRSGTGEVAQLRDLGRVARRGGGEDDEGADRPDDGGDGGDAAPTGAVDRGVATTEGSDDAPAPRTGDPTGRDLAGGRRGSVGGTDAGPTGPATGTSGRPGDEGQDVTT